jgi:hypothetical protein
MKVKRKGYRPSEGNTGGNRGYTVFLESQVTENMIHGLR